MNSGARKPLDPQMQAVIAAFGAHLGEPMREIGADDLRTRRAALRRVVPPPVDVSSVDDFDIPGRDGPIPARHYRPTSSTPVGAVVYFHGGGWVLGSLDESDGFCRLLSGLSGFDVISVDYRLAPEHVYPAAHNDAEDAVAWVSSHVAQGIPLVLMGDSAGGTLAAAVTHSARDSRSGPAIDLQVLVYPVLDHRMNTDSYREHSGKLLLSADDMAWFWDCYIPDQQRRADEQASPGLVDDLRGVPRTLIVVAEYDTMRDESLDYARRLADSGVPTSVHRYDSMAHGFFPMYGTLDTADDAIRSVASEISELVLSRTV